MDDNDRRRRLRRRADAGAIVLGWLTKLAVSFAVVGVVLFDGVSVGLTHMNESDDATTAAIAASDSWHQQHDLDAAVQAAAQSADQHQETVVPGSLSIDADGTVHLELRKTATTVLMARIGPLRKYTVVTVPGQGTSVS